MDRALDNAGKTRADIGVTDEEVQEVLRGEEVGKA
jgi:hypothetical protein